MDITLTSIAAIVLVVSLALTYVVVATRPNASIYFDVRFAKAFVWLPAGIMATMMVFGYPANFFFPGISQVWGFLFMIPFWISMPLCIVGIFYHDYRVRRIKAQEASGIEEVIQK